MHARRLVTILHKVVFCKYGTGMVSGLAFVLFIFSKYSVNDFKLITLSLELLPTLSEDNQ